jgi:hypothetical protein
MEKKRIELEEVCTIENNWRAKITEGKNAEARLQ